MGIISAVLLFCLKNIFFILVKFYQYCISPLKPPTCRFTPTCSQYAIDSIKKYPAHIALWKTIKRLSRCHPWGGNGYDPA